MNSQILIPERVVRGNGVGPAVPVRAFAGKSTVLTLGITRAIPYEGVEVSIWGSADGEDWGTSALFTYPQKFYCGLYSTLLNLEHRPDLKYVRVHWTIQKWAARETPPLFGLQLHMAEPEADCMEEAQLTAMA